MSEIMYFNVALAGLNTVLALGLGLVYWRNHRQIHSPFTFGLLAFSAFLIIHNATTVYHFLTMMPSFAAVGEEMVLFESGLQTAAIVALASATMR